MSQPSPNRVLRSPWLRALVAAGVLGAWAWFLQTQLSELRQYSWRIGALPFAASVLWGALYFVGLGLCWTLLLRSTGGTARKVPLAAGAYIWLSTMLTRYIPGNIWHIVGRVALAGQLGVSRTQVATSATVEQLLTLLGALAVFGLSLPFWGGAHQAQQWLLLLLPLGAALLHPRVLGVSLQWLAQRVRRPELAWHYRYRDMLAIGGAYSGATLAAGFALWSIMSALADATLSHIAFVIGAAAGAWVVGYLSLLTPSGLGVREAALAALLAQVFPLPSAIIGSLVYRLALTGGELVAAGTMLLYLRLRSPNGASQEPATSEPPQ